MSEEKDRVDGTADETKAETKSSDHHTEDTYEKVCFMCRRPESKAGKMITLPGNINICPDCMQKSFDTMNQNPGQINEMMNNMNNMPNIGMFDLSGLSNQIPNRQRVKKKEEKKKKVLTVSADVYRPAAIDQLQTVSQQANIDFFPSTPNEKPLDIARKALEYAKLHYYDVLIVDTAGRLAIDEQMMNEVSDLEKFLNPIETFFVVDAMVGQDAVNTAKAFGEKLPLTGVILTKVDGDSRGGAALSVRMVTGKPIKFMGVGEKLNGFQRFDPQAMAGRILGMGDIVSLVDEVRKNVDIEKAQKFAEKMRKGDDFTLEDFKDQLAQVKNMGSFSSLIEKLPAQFAQAAGQVDDEQAKKQLARTEAIIDSMTPHERRKPEIIKASRKRRIAAGAGTTVQEVNRLLKQFEQSREMMKMMKKGGMGKMMRAFRSLSGRFPGMGGMGGGF